MPAEAVGRQSLELLLASFLAYNIYLAGKVAFKYTVKLYM